MKQAREATLAAELLLQTTNSSGDLDGNNGLGGTANDNDNDEEDNLVIMQLCSQVIPLLFTKSATLQWKKNIDASQVEMQLQSIVREGDNEGNPINGKYKPGANAAATKLPSNQVGVFSLCYRVQDKSDYLLGTWSMWCRSQVFISLGTRE
jgi:hypothetical protein